MAVLALEGRRGLFNAGLINAKIINRKFKCFNDLLAARKIFMLLGLLMYAPLTQIDEAFLSSDKCSYFLNYQLFKKGLN